MMPAAAASRPDPDRSGESAPPVWELFTDPAAPAGGDGSAARPLRTLADAIAALRTLRGNSPRPAQITLRGGFYENTALTLRPEDSHLLIAAAPGETPVLAAGTLLRDWRETADGLLACAVPGVREGTRDFRTLIVNGNFADRARFPETGTLTHESVFDVDWLSSTAGGWARKPTPQELTTLRYRAGDLTPELVVRNAELQVFHQWDDSLVGLAAHDPRAHTLTFSSPAGHPPGAFAERTGKARTYILWNTREGLTRPGQWMLDRAEGRVLYFPRPGETAANLRILAPADESVFLLDSPVPGVLHDLTLRGLELTGTSTPLRSGGFGAGLLPGAVEIAGPAQRIVLEDCVLHHTGGHGIHSPRPAPDAPAPAEILIRRCRIEDCGASGICLRVCRNSIVEDCRIFRCGQVYTSSLALLMHGDGARIAHNEIGWCPYSAIGVCGSVCRVENNRIHHFMEQLDDGAAVYGFAMKNSLYRGNFVTGPGRAERLAHAYYLDEQSEGSVVEQNLAVGTGSPAHNHMSRHCTWRDNLFLDATPSKLVFARCHDFFFERNVIAAPAASFLGPANMFVFFAQNLLAIPAEHAIFDITAPDGYAGEQRLVPPAQEGNAFADPGAQADELGVVRFRQPQLLAERGICPKTDYRDTGPRV